MELIIHQKPALKINQQKMILAIDDHLAKFLRKDKRELINSNLEKINLLNLSILDDLIKRVDESKPVSCYGKIISNRDIFFNISLSVCKDGYELFLQQELTDGIIDLRMPLNLVINNDLQILQSNRRFTPDENLLYFISGNNHRKNIKNRMLKAMLSGEMESEFEYSGFHFSLSALYNASNDTNWHLHINHSKSLKKECHLDEIITRLSVNLLESDVGNYDQIIEEAIQSIGRFTQVDRVYIFTIDYQTKTASNTYEWCNEGITPQIDYLKLIPFDDYQWVFEQIYKEDYVYIENVDELPKEMAIEKTNLQHQEIKSLLIVPILNGKAISGFMGFDSVKNVRKWTQPEIKLLQIAGKLIQNNQIRRENHLKIVESEKTYKYLFHNANDAMMLIDQQTRLIVDANLSACKLYSFDPDQIGNLHTDLLYTSKDRLYQSRFRAIHQNLQGSSFNVEVHASTIHLEGKEYSLLIVRDISEHEKFTRAIRESKKRFQMISEATTDFSFSIIRTTDKAELEWSSDSLKKQFGNKSLDELKSMVHPADVSIFFNFLTQLEADLKAETELRLTLAKYQEYWIHLSAKLEKEDGVDRIIGAARDINEQKKAEIALQESEQRFHFLFDHMPSGSITLQFMDEKILVKDINRYAENILSIKKDGYLEQEFTYLQQLADTRLVYLILQARSTGKVQHIYQHFSEVMPDKVLEVFCYKLPSAEVVILFNDISNRIAMEKALRDSQKNYKILFNNANDSIFIHDLDGNFINVNRIACKKLGYSKSELMRKTPGEIDSPKYRKLITERFANLMENGKISFETEQIRKDGKHIPVDMESRLIKYKDKIAVLSTARDITERKIVEEKLNYELHLNKAISRLAEELLSNKSTVTDMASRVLQYALEITNSKQGFIAEINEDYPGNTAKIIAMVAEGCMLENNSEQEKTAEHVCLNDLVLKTRKSFFTNNPENHPAYKGNKPDGHFSINNFLAVPALINDQIIGQIAIANTSKKYSEADTDAIERIANLYALTIQMEGSRNELEVRNSELNNFVYKVSHDLRAPLASIAGLVNVIRLLALDEQAKSYIDLIDNRIQKLDRFIQDILSHSRNLNTNLNYEKIDLKKLVADVIAELNYMPEARDVKVVLDIDNHDFYSDRLRMKEILRNLISNGFKYHNPYADNKNIRIASRIDYNKASIMYQDNGSGIEKMIMPKIFDMFYKGSDKSNSSGLGLYIVKQAVDKLKGTIEVESSVGTGTRFSIDIPNHVIT